MKVTKHLLLAALLYCFTSCSDAETDMYEMESTTHAAENKVTVVQKTTTTVAEKGLQKKMHDLARGVFQKDKAHLPKEALQKEMALYILDDCKAILLENGYTTADFTSTFADDYQQIILAAMKLSSNPKK